MGRAIGEDILLGGVTMKVNEHFEPLGEVLLPPLEKGNDSLEFWEQMK
jgi:hypothetical protein